MLPNDRPPGGPHGERLARQLRWIPVHSQQPLPRQRPRHPRRNPARSRPSPPHSRLRHRGKHAAPVPRKDLSPGRPPAGRAAAAGPTPPPALLQRLLALNEPSSSTRRPKPLPLPMSCPSGRRHRARLRRLQALEWRRLLRLRNHRPDPATALPGPSSLYAGGPHATWFGRLIYEHTDAFDAIALGEARRHDPAPRRPRRLRPLAARNSPASSSPPPATPSPWARWSWMKPPSRPLRRRRLSRHGRRHHKLKLIVLDDSRGCPYQCAFCTHPFQSGRRMRTRFGSPHRGRHGADHPQPRHPRLPLRRLLHPRQPHGRGRRRDPPPRPQGQYSSFAHFASSAPDHFERMRRSGLVAGFFGLETGSEG